MNKKQKLIIGGTIFILLTFLVGCQGDREVVGAWMDLPVATLSRGGFCCCVILCSFIGASIAK